MLAGKTRKLITPLLILLPLAVLVGSLAVYIHSGATEEPQIPAAASLSQTSVQQDERLLSFSSAAIRVAQVHSPTTVQAPRRIRDFTRVAAEVAESEQPELEADDINAQANDLLELFKRTLQALVAENATLTQNVAELQAALRDSRKAITAANARYETAKRNNDRMIEKRRIESSAEQRLSGQLKEKDRRIAELEAMSSSARQNAEAEAARYQKLVAEHQAATKATKLVKELQAELQQSREQLDAAKQRHDGQLKEKDGRIAELEAIANSARQDADALAKRHQELSLDLQTAVSAKQKAETALNDANKKLLDIEKKHQQMLAALDKVLQPKRAREAALARQRLSEQLKELLEQQEDASKVATEKLAAFDRDAGSATSTLSSASDAGTRVAGTLEKLNQDWDGVLQSASEVSGIFDRADAEMATNAGMLANRAEQLQRLKDAVQQSGAKHDQIASSISDLETTKSSIGSRVDGLRSDSRLVRRLSKSADAKVSAVAQEVVHLGRTLRGDGEPGATKVALSHRAFLSAQEDLRKTTSNAQAAEKLLTTVVSARTKLKGELLPIIKQLDKLPQQVSTAKQDLLNYTDDLERLSERLKNKGLPAAGQIKRDRAKLQGYAKDIGERTRWLSARQLEFAEFNKGLDAAEDRVRISADQLKSARVELSDGLALMKERQLATGAIKTTINSFAQSAAKGARKVTQDQFQAGTSVQSDIEEVNRDLQQRAMRQVTETQAAVTKAIEGFEARLGQLAKLEAGLQASELKLAKLKKALAERMRDVADLGPRFIRLQGRQKALLARNEALDQARVESEKLASRVSKKVSLLQDRLPALQARIRAASPGGDVKSRIASVRPLIAMEPVDAWRLRLTGIDKQLSELSQVLEARRPEPAPLPVRAPPAPLPIKEIANVPAPVAKPELESATAIVQPNDKPEAAETAVGAEKFKEPVAAKVEEPAETVKEPVASKAEEPAETVTEPVAAKSEDAAEKVTQPVAAKAEDAPETVKEPVVVKTEDAPETVEEPVAVKAENTPEKAKEPVTAVAKYAAKQSKKTPAAGRLECNPARPSCRRWLFLRKKKLQLKKGTTNASNQLPAQ